MADRALDLPLPGSPLEDKKISLSYVCVAAAFIKTKWNVSVSPQLNRNFKSSPPNLFWACKTRWVVQICVALFCLVIFLSPACSKAEVFLFRSHMFGFTQIVFIPKNKCHDLRTCMWNNNRSLLKTPICSLFLDEVCCVRDYKDSNRYKNPFYHSSYICPLHNYNSTSVYIKHNYRKIYRCKYRSRITYDKYNAIYRYLCFAPNK